MSRGKLDEETAKKVEDELPNVDVVRCSSLELNPDLISIGFPVGSSFPIAAVCLHDATSVLQEARYALLEAIAHLVWYRVKNNPPNEYLALFFGKFYADDVALRLYAAAEHLANAIINILDIESDIADFKKSKKLGVSSQQAIVGKYLAKNLPTHKITKAILSLRDSQDWKKTRDYRDAWVHQKPPIIKGLGINYQRRNRLKVTNNMMGVTFGSGDEAVYTVDELLNFMKPSLYLLTDATSQIVEHFINYLNENLLKDF
ncbi:MAG: hypothetical protein IPM50_08770 [Acidobacteriota bacterium]|nr:MAG: hypothetical protein IPM50_08770 [Acidobacteriota bacterium]